MRYAVLVLGIIGALLGGFLGFMGTKQINNREQQILVEENRKALDSPLAKLLPPNELQKYTVGVAMFDYRKVASYFLLAMLPLCLAGAAVGFQRKGMIAGILLLGSVLAPVALTFGKPSTVMIGVIMFMLPTIVAGIMAFFVRSRPPAYDDEAPPVRRRRVPVED